MKVTIVISIIMLSAFASAEEIYEIDKLPISTVERIVTPTKECVENPIYDAYDNICGICILQGMTIVRTTDITPPSRKHKLYEVIFTIHGKSYRLRCGEKFDRSNPQLK